MKHLALSLILILFAAKPVLSADASVCALKPNGSKVAVSDDVFMFSFPAEIDIAGLSPRQYDMGPGFKVLSAWCQPVDNLQELARLKSLSCEPGQFSNAIAPDMARLAKESRLVLSWTPSLSSLPTTSKMTVKVYVMVHERDVPLNPDVDGIKVPPLPQ